MSALSQAVPFPVNRHTINGPLKGTGNTLMLSVLGNPRGSYDHDCRFPTNPTLLTHIVTGRDVGPFKVSGLRPAVETLKVILADIAKEKPHIYAVLSHVGMLCCRLVRGSKTAISNHSWGTAIDLTLEGKLDMRGDDKVQRGLLEIHPIFNRHGFFWGAAFGTEDAMHFEVSEQLLLRWVADGEFGGAVTPMDDVLDIGDRGSEISDLQELLNVVLALDLDVDGIFGAQTRAAIVEFQRRNGLALTGSGDRATLRLLKKAVPA